MRRLSIVAATLLLLGSVAMAATAYLSIAYERKNTHNEITLNIVGDVPDPQSTTIPTKTSPSTLPVSTTKLPSRLVELPQHPTASTRSSDQVTPVPKSATPSTDESLRPTQLPASTSVKSPFTVPDPGRIEIPKIGVEAQIEPIGTNLQGEMESPSRYDEVGWWRYGVKPGEYGHAVLAGHLDSPQAPAVFYRLRDLQPGDSIFVWSADEYTLQRFVVQGTALYRADVAPTEDIFSQSDRRELVLITCGGVFDQSSQSYVHRQIVFAEATTEYHHGNPRE